MNNCVGASALASLSGLEEKSNLSGEYGKVQPKYS